jgi:predicted alpha/beta-hydrolase family hydrolase
MKTESRKAQVGDETIRSIWAFSGASKRDAIILGHGAGAGMDHEFMSFFHRALAEAGLLSVKFNFPYMQKGRKAPDPVAKLEAAFSGVLATVAETSPPHTFLGGKSMGGRIASHIAAKENKAAGLILLGYPLHPPGRPERLRTDHFPKIDCPCLFIQGTRDLFCQLKLLGESLGLIPGPVRLHVVEGGDHSLEVLKRSGLDAGKVRLEVLDAILRWMKEVPLAKR